MIVSIKFLPTLPTGENVIFKKEIRIFLKHLSCLKNKKNNNFDIWVSINTSSSHLYYYFQKEAFCHDKYARYRWNTNIIHSR